MPAGFYIRRGHLANVWLNGINRLNDGNHQTPLVFRLFNAFDLALYTGLQFIGLFCLQPIGVVDRIQWGEFAVPEPLRKHLMQDRLFRIPMPSVQLSSTLLRRQFELLDSPDAQIRETARSTLEAGLPTQVYKYLMTKPIYRPKAV